MHPERWAEVERIFHAASARPAGERAAFVRDACGDDEGLRREVESLLAEPASVAGFLDGEATAVAAQLVSDTGASLLTGQRLGTYQLQARIGVGGMGEVYRAHDTKLGRAVAIKILPRHFTSDRDRVARFEREARILASLNHLNVATIHGFENHDGSAALVMELIEGETLAERIARGPLRLTDALSIARQIAEALEAAHERGIVHRDLKPANVKITPDGVVKVLDFGLAKAVTGDAPARDLAQSPTVIVGGTREGVILGTAAYMSPEQARGLPVDKRTDNWAFGCVLFEMLTGRSAFARDTVTDTLAAIVEREPNLDVLPPAVPSRVRQVLGLCLRKDPKQRVSDIRDVRLALDGAFDSSVAQAVTAPLARRTRTRAYVPWILAAVAALSALGAVALYPRPQDAIARFNVFPPQGMVRRPSMIFAASPDGQFLAFVASGADGVPRVLIRRIDTAEAQLLSGTDRAAAVFWAPDSRSLGFTREGGVFRIDLDGSPPRRLCDVPGNTFTGGAWAPGVIVFGGDHGLVRIPDTGGTPTPVTTLDAGAKEARHIGPWFLPDGRHLLFLALATGQTHGVVWAASIDDPARTRITESAGAIAYADDWLLSTTGAPRRVVAQRFDAKRLSLQGFPQPVHDRPSGPTTSGNRGFAVSSNGVLVVDRPSLPTSRLEWVDRTGRVESVLGPSGTILSFAIAPDDRRVVAQVVDRDLKAALWLFEPGRIDGTRLTYGRVALRPLWSRDNRHVHFSRPVGSGDVLFTIAVGETAATPFENLGPFVFFEDATRDGQYLVFKSFWTPSEIWMQRVGSKERRALVQSPFPASWPRVSPDSRWLAYTLALPSGEEVFAQPFNRVGDRIQVSRGGGGIGPIWRDDSRELYYEGPDGLMAVEMTDRDGTLAAGTPQKLFPLHTQGSVSNKPHNVEVAAHGQKFLVNSIVGDSDNVPLEVTLNWTSGLK